MRRTDLKSVPLFLACLLFYSDRLHLKMSIAQNLPLSEERPRPEILLGVTPVDAVELVIERNDRIVVT